MTLAAPLAREVHDLVRSRLPGVEWQAVGPGALPPIAPPAAPLRTLERALRAAARPVILVNDAERAQPTTLVDVLGTLWEAHGARAKLVVATGTHASSAASQRDRLGGLPAEVHDAKDAAAHGDLPLDGGGPPARLDRRVLDADLVLAFGSVEPHYFAGWTGGHKTASVGMQDRATTERNHRNALSGRAQPTALEGNPVFDGLARVLVALERDRRVLVVNHVLDDRARPVSACVGTWRGSLERSLAAARALFVREVPAPQDVIVARVRGPLGRSLYQADKGVKNTEDAVRDGGELILEAGFEDGLGPDRFLELLAAAPTLADAEARAEKAYVLGDHKAVRWRRLEARGVRVRIVGPTLPRERLLACGLEVHASLADALAAVAKDGRVSTGRGLIVEDAGLMVPRVVPRVRVSSSP